MKKRVVAKAQKIRRRNRERQWSYQYLNEPIPVPELELTAEELRQRAIKRAKEERDGSNK